MIRQIPSVAGDFDAGQDDLADRTAQRPALSETAVGRERADMAAGVRDDAIGAVVVTAVLNFEQGAGVSRENAGGKLLKDLMRFIWSDRTAGLTIADGVFAQVEDMGAVGRAAHDADALERRGKVRVGLCQTAAERDDGIGIVPAHPAKLAQVFVGSRRGHRTGIQNTDVGTAVRNRVSALLCQLDERLRFKLIDLTAECRKTKLHDISHFLYHNNVFPLYQIPKKKQEAPF